MKNSLKSTAVKVLNWHINMYNTGLKGRLKLIGLWTLPFLMSGLIAVEPERRVEVSSGQAVIHKRVQSWAALDYVAMKVLNDVYEVARSNPEVKQVRVSLTMSKAGLSDEYGNPAQEDIQMGDLTWDAEDLQEARRYQDRSLYSVHETRNALYRHHIQGMRGGHLLKD